MAIGVLQKVAAAPSERAAARPASPYFGVLPIAGGFAVVGLLVLLPLATVMAQAFSSGAGAFVRAFNDPYTLAAIRLTLVVAGCTVAFGGVFGILAAWTITKYRFPGKALLVSAIDLPLTVSPVVAGLAILLAVGKNTPIGALASQAGIHIAFAPPGIILATILVTFPYVTRELSAYMQEQGRDLEEAALLLGASPWQTLWRVTLPEAKWALLNGLLLCNARAMGEFGAVTVISGRILGQTNTVPLQIENLYNDNAFVATFALSASLAIVAMVLTIVRAVCERLSRSDYVSTAPTSQNPSVPRVVPR